jgi:FKBP-type peptidyl-prolyl cis-trans isomerase
VSNKTTIWIVVAVVAVAVIALVAFTQCSSEPEEVVEEPIEQVVEEPAEEAEPTEEDTGSVTTEAVTELQIEDIVVGEGAEAIAGSSAVVHYTGWLEDGTKFDSSYDREVPFVFTVGEGMVITGWDQGVEGMKVGGKRRLVIPPELAYGAQGAGGVIPPNAVLVFEVELVNVQ